MSILFWLKKKSFFFLISLYIFRAQNLYEIWKGEEEKNIFVTFLIYT